MKALLARRVDIAWLLLVAALSGAALVMWLTVQSTAPPGGAVFIVRAAATSAAGQGGAPVGEVIASPVATPKSRSAVILPESTLIPAATESVTAAQVVQSVAPTPYPTTPSLPDGARLNINQATAEELEALPGIGPVLAARIVQDREANGPFASVEDLERVDGIGDGIVRKVRDHVTAGP
jgi:competence protein ComEA